MNTLKRLYFFTHKKVKKISISAISLVNRFTKKDSMFSQKQFASQAKIKIRLPVNDVRE